MFPCVSREYRGRYRVPILGLIDADTLCLDSAGMGYRGACADLSLLSQTCPLFFFVVRVPVVLVKVNACGCASQGKGFRVWGGNPEPLALNPKHLTLNSKPYALNNLDPKP